MKPLLLALLCLGCSSSPVVVETVVASDPVQVALISGKVRVGMKYTENPSGERELALQRTYNADGLVVEEISYRRGKPVSTVAYTYHADFSVHTVEKNGKSHQRRTLSEGGLRVTEETFLLHDTLRTVTQNDDLGRPLSSTSTKDGEVRIRNTYKWSVTGDTLYVNQLVGAEQRNFTQYLEDGRVIQEQRFAEGAEIYLEQNTYDTTGRLTHQSRMDKAGCIFTTTFTYQDGLPQTETTGFECDGREGETVYSWEYQTTE